MADNIIKQIRATDGTVYELDAKYFNGRTFEEVFAQADAMIYKGVISFTSTTGNRLYTEAANKGHVYKVSIATGVVGSCYVNDILVDNGDMLICNTDNTPIATAEDPQSGKWDVIQSNIDASGLATATHVHSYTPEGTVSKPEFTGTQVDSTSGQADITSVVTDPNHSHGIEHTATSTGKNSAGVTVATSDHVHSVTAEGNVSVSLTDNGHSHAVTAAGSVEVSRTQDVAASTVENGAHTHTINLQDVEVTVTDSQHKHTAEVTQGTAAAQKFTGTESDTKATAATAVQAAAPGHTHEIEGTGTAEAQVFKGEAGTTNKDTVNVVEVSTSAHTHTYKPEGTISGSFTGSEDSTTGINGVVNVAADGHVHGGALKAVVTSNVLTFTMDGEVSASTTKTAVATSAHTHTYTPSGSFSNLKFEGKEATIDATDTTHVADVSNANHVHGFTPRGTNSASAVTVSGTAQATTAESVGAAAPGHTHKFTAVGTNDASAVSGTSVSISNAATGISAQFSIESGITGSAGAHTHTVDIASQPTFSAEFTGQEVSTAKSATAISASASFTGTEVFTSAPTSDGVEVAALEHSHTYDKATTIVSAATGITVKSTDAGHIHKVTAAGTVSQPTFKGVAKQTGGPESQSN